MELFHTLNRGVEKRDVVLDNSDRLRFLHDLYVFNDLNEAPNYVLAKRHTSRDRQKLVDIHAFCLMKNHYHLLLSECLENGISLFLKKLNGGYAKYFNERYSRSGALWQGKTRKIRIEKDPHFLYIPFYIHLNPLDYKYPSWRNGSVSDVRNTLKYLAKYRWSSFLDYTNRRNFPSIIYTDTLSELLGNRTSQEAVIHSIISDPRLAQQSAALEPIDT